MSSNAWEAPGNAGDTLRSGQVAGRGPGRRDKMTSSSGRNAYCGENNLPGNQRKIVCDFPRQFHVKSGEVIENKTLRLLAIDQRLAPIYKTYLACAQLVL